VITFIVRRLLLGVVVLFGVIAVTFVLTRVIPSDPTVEWVGSHATAAQKAQGRKELGLDKPLYLQFIVYLGDLAQGNLGRDLETHQPVTKELRTYLPATLELVLMATFVAVLVGLPLGVLSARKKDHWLDHTSRIFSVGFVSMPTFWIALFLQFIFYSRLGILPSGGEMSEATRIFESVPAVTHSILIDSLLAGNLTVFGDAFRHMILPAIALAAYPLGLVARMTRSALLEILNEDYITAANSYGLSGRVVLWSYALKNSLGPTVTVITLSIGFTLVNTFLVESIFSWPGIGTYIASAVTTFNYPAIMGVTMFSAVVYIVLNMVADIVIALDPRARIRP